MDMIGDADLNIDRDTNSTPWLLDLVYQAAERSGVQSHFYARAGAMDDDHLPFVKRGVPSIDSSISTTATTMSSTTLLRTPLTN